MENNRVKKIYDRFVIESKFGCAKDFIENLIKKTDNKIQLYFDLKKVIALAEANGDLNRNYLIEKVNEKKNF